MTALRLLAFSATLATASAAWAQPSLQLAGILGPGDERCANLNLCERYGLVFDAGAQVRVQVVTQGFPSVLRAVAPQGSIVSGAGPRAELRFVANPGVTYTVEVNAADPSMGQYAIDVSPRPSRYLAPPPPGPEDREPDARVRDVVAQMMRGYRAATPMMIGRLDQVPELRFPAKRGHCYRAVVILGHGARRATPTTTVQMEAQIGSEARARGQSARSTERVLALDEDLCPPSEGALVVTFRDRGHALPLPSAGTGPFTLQLFERSP